MAPASDRVAARTSLGMVIATIIPAIVCIRTVDTSMSYAVRLRSASRVRHVNCAYVGPHSHMHTIGRSPQWGPCTRYITTSMRAHGT